MKNGISLAYVSSSGNVSIADDKTVKTVLGYFIKQPKKEDRIESLLCPIVNRRKLFIRKKFTELFDEMEAKTEAYRQRNSNP